MPSAFLHFVPITGLTVILIDSPVRSHPAPLISTFLHFYTAKALSTPTTSTQPLSYHKHFTSGLYFAR